MLTFFCFASKAACFLVLVFDDVLWQKLTALPVVSRETALRQREK